MKILVVSNIYPPHFIGGYELGCRDVVEALRQRGHSVHVLTSNFSNVASSPGQEDPLVVRTLSFQSKKSRLRHHFTEYRKLSRVMASFTPDLVYFWNLAGISPWLPVAARVRRCPCAFFLFDASFVFWRVGAWLSRRAQGHDLIRRIFGRTFLVKGWNVLRHQLCHFGSEFLRKEARDAGIDFDESRSLVIKWGIDPNPYLSAGATRERGPIRKLLYVGQISPIKGIHTAISAFAELVSNQTEDFHFTIVGGGESAYEQQLREQVRQLNLEGRVEFKGKVARENLPGIYAAHDLLVFPSEWAEPFGITRLEAMATGLPVVGTITGGSGELLRNGKTGFTFQAGDAKDCLRALREACFDPEKAMQIARCGHETVLRDYSLTAMGATIERSLLTLTRANG